MFISTSVLSYAGVLVWYCGYQMSKFANFGSLNLHITDLPFSMVLVLLIVELVKKSLVERRSMDKAF